MCRKSNIFFFKLKLCIVICISFALQNSIKTGKIPSLFKFESLTFINT